MGFGRSKKETQVTSTVPKHVEEFQKELINRSKATMNKPAEERIYQGDRVVGNNDLLNQGFSNVKNSLGKYESQVKNDTDTFRQNVPKIQINRFADQAGQDLANKIQKTALERFEEDYAKKIADARRRAALSGRSYGISTEEDDLRRLMGRERSKLEADLAEKAFNIFDTEEKRVSAQQVEQAGIDEKSFARLLESAKLQYNMNEGDIARLLNSGILQRAIEQEVKDAEIAKFNEMANRDRSELEWLSKIGGQNQGGQIETVNKGNKPSAIGQVAGTLANIASKFI